MTFESMEDYVAYNSDTDYNFEANNYYSGSVDGTKVALDSLKAVKNGEMVTDAYTEADNHAMVLVSGENTVVVPGNIVAISENVEVTGKTQAKIISADKPACVIYEK